MAAVTVLAGNRQVTLDQVTPTAVASSAVLTVVAGSEVDSRGWRSLAYTIKNAGANSVDWTVFGANLADYSDEVVVQAATTVANAASGSYSTTQAPFAFYRVKIVDTAAPNHGTVTVVGTSKS